MLGVRSVRAVCRYAGRNSRVYRELRVRLFGCKAVEWQRPGPNVLETRAEGSRLVPAKELVDERREGTEADDNVKYGERERENVCVWQRETVGMRRGGWSGWCIFPFPLSLVLLFLILLSCYCTLDS